MGKSLGNYIGISEAPGEIFGKLMSVSDELMWRYFDLLSFRSNADLDALRAAVEGGRNPRDVKVELATEIVARFHGQPAAAAATQEFERRYRDRQLPSDIPTTELVSAGTALPIPHVLKESSLAASTSEARRMIKQGAVKIDGARVDDIETQLAAGDCVVIQVGKRRIARVSIK